jgi:hypothetical protein
MKKKKTFVNKNEKNKRLHRKKGKKFKMVVSDFEIK